MLQKIDYYRIIALKKVLTNSNMYIQSTIICVNIITNLDGDKEDVLILLTDNYILFSSISSRSNKHHPVTFIFIRDVYRVYITIVLKYL